MGMAAWFGCLRQTAVTVTLALIVASCAKPSVAVKSYWDVNRDSSVECDPVLVAEIAGLNPGHRVSARGASAKPSMLDEPAFLRIPGLWEEAGLQSIEATISNRFGSRRLQIPMPQGMVAPRTRIDEHSLSRIDEIDF